MPMCLPTSCWPAPRRTTKRISPTPWPHLAIVLRGSADPQRDEMATAIESMPPTHSRLEALSYYMIKPQKCELTSLCCMIKMQNCELSSLYYIVNSQNCELPSLYYVVNSQSCELPSLYHIVHSQFCALLFGRTYPLLQGGNRGLRPWP